MRPIVLGAMLILAAPAGGLAQTADLSAEARRIAAPVTNAVREAVTADAALPPPASTRERLERMGRLDQAGRAALVGIDFERLAPPVRTAVLALINEALAPVDRANMARLSAMIPADGWFTRGQYGAEASEAAFLIVQHAADLATRKALLPRLRPLAERGEIDGGEYALLYDRTVIWDGGRQRYGTQFTCAAGRTQPQPLEAPDRIEALRAALRMRQTYADYVKAHAGQPC